MDFFDYVFFFSRKHHCSFDFTCPSTMIACQNRRLNSSVYPGRRVRSEAVAMAMVPVILNCCSANQNVWNHSIDVWICCDSALGRLYVSLRPHCGDAINHLVCCSMPVLMVFAISNHSLCYSILTTMNCYVWGFARSLSNEQMLDKLERRLFLNN